MATPKITSKPPDSSKGEQSKDVCDQAKPSAASKIFKDSIESIAVVFSESGQGSGFTIKQDDRYTFILTNSHVVNGEDKVKVKWIDGREDKGTVVADYGADEMHRDIALVRVDGARGLPLTLKSNTPVIGSDIVVIGAPRGLEFSLTKGVISQIRKNGDFLQIDAPVNPGNSGGPVFDESGCVVGLVTFKGKESEGLNFAIGYSPINHFLKHPVMERKYQAKKRDERRNEIYYPEDYDLSKFKPPLAPLPVPSGRGWQLEYAKCWASGTHGVRKSEYCLFNDSRPPDGIWISAYLTPYLQPEGLTETEFQRHEVTVSFQWIRYLGSRGSYAHYQLQDSYITRELIRASESYLAKHPYTKNGLRETRKVSTFPVTRGIVDCNNWLIAIGDGRFSPVIPGSNGDRYAKEACRVGKPVEAE